jgi:hypothetical protein
MKVGRGTIQVEMVDKGIIQAASRVTILASTTSP